MTCPICGGPLDRGFEVRGYDIGACRRCGHRCVRQELAPDHVPRVYSREYFYGGGAGYADYPSEAALLRDHGLWYARLLSRHMAPGRLLDVGAAAGFVLEGLMEGGWRGRGLEPNPEMCELANARLGPIVDVGILEEWRGGEEHDLITMIQVVSHFRDLGRAMEAAALATRAGGFWLVETWNRGSVTARAFGRRWHEYSPPSVLRWFTPADLARLGGRHGFREVARGRPPKWLDVGHARSLLGHASGGMARTLGLALLALFPGGFRLPYLGDDLFWMLLKKEGASAPPAEADGTQGGAAG